MALVFALLLASALSVGGESTQPWFVSVYKPEFNVNAYASLDLDMREIESLAVTGNKQDLLTAWDVYSGADGDSGGSGFTLQDLADVSFGELDGSETLKLYKDFYGTAEYSDKWLRAAFNEKSTESFSNGKADFTKLDLKGRSAAVQHGIRAMAIWGHIVGLVEKTAERCDGTRGNSVEQKMWDRAVALYVGSTARESGAGGHLLYTLANEECYHFGRCKKGEEAPVNKYIMAKFAKVKLYLDIGGCSNLKNDARDIKSLMTVPLIQAASRAMYTIDKEDSTDGALQGEAAAYAAALLPLIHQCGAGNSKIIEADMLPGKSVSGSYEVVKAAFERCYEKLGVSCEDVGGLVDFSKKQYKRGAQACGGVMPGQGVIEGFVGSFPAQSPTSESQKSWFVSVYKPEFNVNAYASLDLDMREIESLAVTGNKQDLLTAWDVYSGADGDSGGSGITLEDLADVGDLDGSETLKLYKDFYGTAEYSDKWLRAALNGESTESFSNGKADFTKLDLKGRSAAVQHGIRAMAIWGHIVGLVEKTADVCDFDDTRDKSVEQKMWDRAVALYVGSTARESGAGGHLLYTLANEECYHFGRCKKGEEAPVNKYIMAKFANGKLNICSNIKKDARDIKSLMTVPLIQAASRAMYTIDKEDSTDGALQGEAAAYAAALLPLIHQCGAGNSRIIEADMLPGKSVSGSYEVVKAAFERCYEKLGVSCEDVGGLVDFSKKQYKRGAQACGGVMPGQGVISGFAGSFPAQSPTSESQKSQPYQPAAPTSGKAQSSSSGGVNIALIVGLSSVCTLFFVMMVVALSKRKSPRSHKSPPNVMFEMGDEPNPNGGEPAMALDENSIV